MSGIAQQHESDALEALVGQTFFFYGASECQFKLDNNVYEAIEDEDDGYHSYLQAIKIVDSKAIFFQTPIAKVKVEHCENLSGYSSNEGYALVDVEDGHVWLKVGTANTDDYYPWFVFEYIPKKG